MKKLLFFDIDGTLVDFGKSTMSPSTADALINAKQNGHMIFLCTGRSYNQIYPSLKAFAFDGVVAAAGGYVTVGDKVIAHHVYGQNLLQKVLDTVGDNDTGLIFQTKDKSITNHKWADKFISAFSKQFDMHVIQDNPTFKDIVRVRSSTVFLCVHSSKSSPMPSKNMTEPAVSISFLKIDTPIAVASSTGTSIFRCHKHCKPFQRYFTDLTVVTHARSGYGRNILPA